ncbi:unnamed protein product [Mytilus coruscus]|uniref:Uncharacterized protein n=1 Tax=Mytilus coruscus TaxID=42192 RepID=A0A6J8B156_MYTCO|nr:unnamed protein product [Mytilus coruscus]
MSTTTTDSWQQITSKPDATANPECLRLESFKHLFNIKGLDACEPHHISWHHLQELTNTNWRCRENIINVMSGALKTTQKRLDGVAPELKMLYENDTCAVHEIERFNGSLEQYENDKCFCYPSFGLKTVPADCNKYGGFSRLHVNGLITNNCMTHFSVWKYLATQPAVCQDWIINFMLDHLHDDFSCDCHEHQEPPQTGHGVSFVGRSLNKRDTPFLPSCEHDSQGWKVMQTDFLSNVCRSHWYIWRHLADNHGHCRRYLINEMFAKFASTTPHCKCESKMTSTPTLPTTTMPPHMCSQCNGSSCVTTGGSVTCGTNQNVCMTSIIDYNDNNSGKLERLIERKCASKQECADKDQSGNMFCLQLPQGNLGFPYTCRFCCVGQNCNKPPALIPALSTRFSSNFP